MNNVEKLHKLRDITIDNFAVGDTNRELAIDLFQQLEQELEILEYLEKKLERQEEFDGVTGEEMLIDYISLMELSKEIGVYHATVYQWAKKKKVDSIKLAGSIFINIDSYNDYMESRRNTNYEQYNKIGKRTNKWYNRIFEYVAKDWL